MQRVTVLAFLLAFVSSGVTADEVETQYVPTSDPAVTGTILSASAEPPLQGRLPRARPDFDSDRQLHTMIGQMILVGFPGSNPSAEWPKWAARLIEYGQIGGVVLYSDNVASPRQLKSLTESLNSSGGVLRPFICVDQEGGTIQRLPPEKGFVGLPSAERIARMEQASAYRLFRRTAKELSDLGINVNFGPVVDINTNPRSDVIGRLGRSYSGNVDTVIAYGRQFVDAHEQAGVLTAAKHFPGHGSARDDPHDRVTDVSRTWQEIELVPFVDLISDDFVDMIMVGHLIHPRFSDGDRPASLSAQTMTEVLRNQLGFEGLVVTDDLDMAAIRKRYSIEEAAIIAVAAGADLLIVANHEQPDQGIPERIIGAVSRAVAQGTIPRETVEQAYRRIIKAKQKLADQRAYVMQ